MADYPAPDAGHVIEIPGSLSSKLSPAVRAAAVGGRRAQSVGRRAGGLARPHGSRRGLVARADAPAVGRRAGG